jgi:hypothetical protein
MPLAAPSAASCVSSDRWAEASNPVIVYWVSRKPSGSTYIQYPSPLVSPPASPPLLLTRIVKTSEMLMCFSGRKTRMRMMTAAPTTCHHTEMLLSVARMDPPKMLTQAVRARMARNIQNTRCRL